MPENIGTTTGTTGEITSAETAETGLPENIKEILAKERKATREAKAQVGEYQAKVKAFEDAQLSESERVSKERDELRVELEGIRREAKTSQAREKLITAATTLGTKNPARVLRLVDAAALESGSEIDAVSVLNAIKTEFPELFQAGKPAGSADGAATGATTSSAREFSELVRQRLLGA